jgi:UDP-2,3-diacylglucosamine pyrophosphatase LpxH
MMNAEFLSTSEPERYGEEIVSIETGDKDLFVISDLHMAAGLNGNGNYDGTENFFADYSLSRFLDHIRDRVSLDKKALLVINGDFIDFLRIRSIPDTKQDFEEWSEILNSLGIIKSVNTLQSSISKKERIYGLRTDDYKSIWKLHICCRGHQQVFKSLSAWLAGGNELLVVKGNHDLEWVWRSVRDYLRLLLDSKRQIRFADDKLIINKRIYVEHGHRYENFTCVNGQAILQNGTELNLPFGSFFNRYLINRIELAFPYIDDVRPRQKILPLLIRERFPLALQMLFRYIPFCVLIIPKKQYAYALRYLIQFIWIILIPLGLTIFGIFETYHHPLQIKPAGSNPSFFSEYILPQLKNVLFLSLSYFLARLFSILSLSAPSSLYPDAQIIFDAYAEIDQVTFGHTHDPEQKRSGGKSYYNTGTWIPVYELDAADVRLDRTYTFLHFKKREMGVLETEGLMRWNDDAGRSDKMELRDSI